MRKLILMLSLSALLYVGVEAQTRSFTLDEAQAYAITHSLQAQTAKLDLAAARATVRQTTAVGLPQLSAKANYQQFIDIPTQLIPAEFFGGEAGTFAEVQFGTKHNATAELSASQLLFDGTYIVGLKAAKVYRSLSEITNEKTDAEIKAAIADSYYLILVAEENKTILTQTSKNLEQSLFEMTKLYESGFIEETEKDQMELTVGRIRNNLATVERQIALGYQMFKYQLGIGQETDIALTDKLETVMKSINPDVLMVKSMNLDEHVDFKLARTQQELQKLNMRKEQVSNLPSIAAFGSHQQNAQRNVFNFGRSDQSWFPTTVIGVNLSIPLFTSGLNYQTTNLARIDWEKAKINQQLVEEGLRLQEIQARDNFLTGISTYQTEENNMQLALRIFNTSLIKYREGMISGLELTQAQNQLLETQGSYINSILNYLQTKTAFEKAINAL